MNAEEVGKLQEKIQKEIKEKNMQVDKIPEFSEIRVPGYREIPEDLDSCIKQLDWKWQVQAYRNIPSGRGIFGKIKRFFQKAVRKSNSFYIQPIVKDQNEYNETLAHTIELMKKEIDDLKKQIENRNQG